LYRTRLRSLGWLFRCPSLATGEDDEGDEAQDEHHSQSLDLPAAWTDRQACGPVLVPEGPQKFERFLSLTLSSVPRREHRYGFHAFTARRETRVPKILPRYRSQRILRMGAFSDRKYDFPRGT
jgi:hypothetical protein